MRIAFPSQEDRGFDSPVYGHFGSAPYFIVVESDSGSCETIINPDRDHLHGHCQPLSAFAGTSVDAVVVGGIGGGALRQLNAAGVQAYRAVEGTVAENLALIQAERLPTFTPALTCAGHSQDGGCSH
jgi:predicted Fe-Mo cluster-binding NifX family protein